MSELAGDELVERAESIAREAHAGQPDKAGEPYIGHPARVAARLDDPTLQAAAWLHDVVEDTSWTLTDLGDAGVPDDVIEIVDAVTKRKDEVYSDAVRRAASHPRARLVKAADVADNADEARLARVREREPVLADRLEEKYRAASAILREHPDARSILSA